MDEQTTRLMAAALDVVTAVSDQALRRRQTHSAMIPYAHLLELEAAVEAIMPGVVARTRELEAERRR